MFRIRDLAVAALIAASAATGAPAQSTSGDASATDLNNGKYFYYVGGCASCHAAPASAKCDDAKYKDDQKPVGGRCLKTGFGTFYVPNITPDQQTGLGGWSSDDFIKAMTTGISPSGENYYPAFPYASFQKMKRSDLLDLWAFLRTLEPVNASVPPHELSFPYSIRRGVSVWKALYLDAKPFTADATKSDQVNRGAYLVEGPAHCGECHTPRSALGGMITSRKLAGGPAPEGSGFIPNLTPHATGIGSWSEKDISYGLFTGFKPNGDVMGGAMAAVQQNMTHLTPEDRDAMAAYLKSIPSVENARPKKK